MKNTPMNMFTEQELAILHMTHDFKRDEISTCTWFDSFQEIFFMSKSETRQAAKRLASIGLVKIKKGSIFLTKVADLLFQCGFFGKETSKKAMAFLNKREIEEFQGQ
jgi:hypothetical protein